MSSTFSKANLSIVRQANAAPAGIGNLTAMSTNPGSQTSLASNATSGAALTRYVGVSGCADQWCRVDRGRLGHDHLHAHCAIDRVMKGEADAMWPLLRRSVAKRSCC